MFGGGVVIDFVGSKRLPKINPEPMPGLKVVLSLTPEHFKGNTLSTRLVSKGLSIVFSGNIRNEVGWIAMSFVTMISYNS